MVLPLNQAGGQVGTLTISESGERAELLAEAVYCVEGIYRLFLRLQGGSVPLGIMEQQGKQLFLKRSISRKAIASLGMPICGELVLSYAYPKQQAWEKITISRLRELAFPFWEELWENCTVEYRKDEKRRVLRCSYQKENAFPIPSLFCLASIQEEGGEAWVYFAFSEDWQPLFYKKPASFQK